MVRYGRREAHSHSQYPQPRSVTCVTLCVSLHVSLSLSVCVCARAQCGVVLPFSAVRRAVRRVRRFRRATTTGRTCYSFLSNVMTDGFDIRHLFFFWHGQSGFGGFWTLRIQWRYPFIPILDQFCTTQLLTLKLSKVWEPSKVWPQGFDSFDSFDSFDNFVETVGTVGTVEPPPLLRPVAGRWRVSTF